jgi:hypothetical protein
MLPETAVIAVKVDVTKGRNQCRIYATIRVGSINV